MFLRRMIYYPESIVAPHWSSSRQRKRSLFADYEFGMLPIFCDKKKFNFDAYRIITVIFNAKIYWLFSDEQHNNYYHCTHNRIKFILILPII